MAMTRQVLAETIGLDIPELLAAVGISADDTPGNLKGSIDQALRAMGRTSSTLADDVSDADEGAAIAVSTLYALRRIQKSLSEIAVDTQIDGPTVNLKDSQRFANLSVLIADAETAAAPYITVGGTSSWVSGAIYTDTFATGECYE